LRARKRKGRRHDNLIVQSDESSNQSIIFNVSGTLVSPTPAISPITPPKRRGRPPNRTPALVNEPAKVSKKIVKKPAKIVREQAKVAKKPAKIVKEQAKVAKKPAKIVKEQAKVAKKPAKQPVTRTADKVLEQLEVEEKEDSIRRSQRVLSKKK
jgi:outer membrane biosynthesis protein TonB